MIRTDTATSVRPKTYMLIGFNGDQQAADFQIGLLKDLGYTDVTITPNGREASMVLQDLSKPVPDEIKFDLLLTSESEQRYLNALVQARRDLATLHTLQTPEGKRKVLEVLVKESLGIK